MIGLPQLKLFSRLNACAAACGATLYLTAQHKTIAVLALTYLLGAVGP